jgi:hypothetical protein
METTLAMAKKKKLDNGEQRDSLIAIRCRSTYKAWVESFARSERITPTSLVDIALVELAKTKGFEPPPER